MGIVDRAYITDWICPEKIQTLVNIEVKLPDGHTTAIYQEKSLCNILWPLWKEWPVICANL